MLEINTLLKKHPHSRPVFNGVYARNRLPRLLNVPSALVAYPEIEGTFLINIHDI
jgi:hypothetical protein